MLNCEIAMKAAETLVEQVLKGAQPTEAHLRQCMELLREGLTEVNRPHLAWGKGSIQVIRDDWDDRRCSEALEYVRHELVQRSAEAGEKILEDLLVRFEKAKPC
ncbi:hypothetical protein GMLC_39020 [Geomonas limicola]|uniref:Uncharacterized protein n=1 Tax=Geomonas limicola TaxID=2740186 RepID=A0A6V8NFH0_9BACT|nr:hypothetical protein [Geomonas limicola]GFO70323.1 hypothetical protein GMLC_39020 [Geomonas limicola]